MQNWRIRSGNGKELRGDVNDGKLVREGCKGQIRHQNLQMGHSVGRLYTEQKMNRMFTKYHCATTEPCVAGTVVHTRFSSSRTSKERLLRSREALVQHRARDWSFP